MKKLNCLLSCATAFSFFLGAWSAFAASGVAIRVLSSRADMVTGGYALVEANAGPGTFSAALNGQDITKFFRPGKTAGTLLARVEGLQTGKNTLEIKSAK